MTIKNNLALEICYEIMLSVINNENSISLNAYLDEYYLQLMDHNLITEEQRDRLTIAINKLYDVLSEIKC